MCLEYKIYICRHLSFRCTFQSSNQCTDWMCFLRWSMIFLRHMVYTQHHRLNRLHCSIFQQGTRRIDRQNQDQHSPKNDLQKKVNQIKTSGKTVGNTNNNRKTLPSEQSWHSSLAVNPVASDQRPTGHFLHWSLTTNPISLEYVPALQRPVQSASWVNPVASENCPTEQRPRHCAAAASPVLEEKVPAGHRPKH